MTRRYDAHGRTGCVQIRTARTTGTRVGVYRNDQAGLDDDDGRTPWSTVCEDHGTIVSHPTLSLARRHAPDPEGWCEGCQAAADVGAPVREEWDADAGWVWVADDDDDPIRTMPAPRVDIDALPLQTRMDRFSGTNPCHVCGRELTGRQTWDVVMVDSDLVAVDDWDRVGPDTHPGFLGAYQVGSGCARKIPAAFKRRSERNFGHEEST